MRWTTSRSRAPTTRLAAILGKLGDFRGESRFTTWAYKFALYEAAAQVRRRAWQGRELPRRGRGLDAVHGPGAGATATRPRPPSSSPRSGDEIEIALSPHQRDVLVALALNEVPIDVLAERLNTTRGALYKTLHDARKRLRAALSDRGISVEGHLTEEEG